MKQTPLNQLHQSQQAMMVDFHGWQLPLHYGSQIKEHMAVRQACGIFDVSHMTVVDILGAGGRTFLRFLLSNDIDSLNCPGQAFYSCMLNQHGGIIDDLIVYYRAPDNFRLVLNSATREKDLAWLKEQSAGFSVWLQERSELGIIAIQGPKAFDILQDVLSPAHLDAISTLRPFEVVDVQDCFFARTGYTGEDGFEIICQQEQLVSFWQKMLDAGAKPCGLGARDTLRLEAGMMLYGQDLTENTHPFESGLSWTVKFSPKDRNFIGRGALQALKLQPPKLKMVGLVLEGAGVMRSGISVFDENESQIGTVTSGGYSPCLNQSIAFARVSADIGETCWVSVRNKLQKAKVTAPRFVKNGKKLVNI